LTKKYPHLAKMPKGPWHGPYVPPIANMSDHYPRARALMFAAMSNIIVLSHADIIYLSEVLAHEINPAL
jgi:hypothetical protein